MTTTTEQQTAQSSTAAGRTFPVRSAFRQALASVTRRLPVVRGLGRIVLAADKILTVADEPASYEAPATVNNSGALVLDLRTWEQKFAFYYGTYEPEYLAATSRLFDGGIFYDIGASIGLYTVPMALKCVANGGFVRAFEPVPQNLRRLDAQLNLNGLNSENVRIEKVALSNAPGTAKMDLCDDGKPGNAKITGSGQVSVDVTTLDQIWQDNDRERIDFVKIDTEGWDANILAGGREAISTCRPNLLIEFNRERMNNHGIELEPAWEFLKNDLSYRSFSLDEAGKVTEISEPGQLENLFFVQEDAVSAMLGR